MAGKEFNLAGQLFYSPSKLLGSDGKCNRWPASPIYISRPTTPTAETSTIATQTNDFSGYHSLKISKFRRTRIRNLKEFLDHDFKGSSKRKKKRQLLRKKLNCYKNLRSYKIKHKARKKATVQQIFINNLMPYFCTIELQNKLLCSEVQNIKRLLRGIYNVQFKM